MVGTIFRKHVERYEAGEAGKSLYQTWKVVTDLGDDVYSCVRVDSTEDPMGAASPKKRTFKGKDILKYLKNK
jgi:predicted transcriptional regulator